ncbi:PAS domain-containing protein [Streptomyces sp. V4I23]|uniref:PAS domain-containing protein n=1 Tax=Streptomyces sp. V4I23 TaxID=3042282 RepID=UPI0027855009|nr:PAS domain-containing protein [Streptomyces sp. V4I23]MDQ1013270.1 PAS domain-containing protein [Streptomyces sp. V4I23]
MSTIDMPHPAAKHGALITIDCRGCTTMWSPMAQTMLGYAPQQVIGRSLNTLLATPAPTFWTQKTEAEWAGTLAFNLPHGHTRHLFAQACCIGMPDREEFWLIYIEPAAAGTECVFLIPGSE